MERKVSQRELPSKSWFMLLLPSTTNHTVGVMGEVLCVPCAQLSFGPFGRVAVEEPPAAPAAPLVPITKPPPAVDDVLGAVPGVVGVLGAVPADVLMPVGTPPRFAVPEIVGLPLQAAAMIKLTSSAGIV